VLLGVVWSGDLALMLMIGRPVDLAVSRDGVERVCTLFALWRRGQSRLPA